MLPRLAVTFALTILFCSSAIRPACAQGAAASEQDMGAPAHVALVDGVASLEREGRTENPLNMPLLSGDRLKTADGRVEVSFADGSTLHLDRSTTIDVQSDDLIRLIDGRVRLNIPGTSRSIAYRIDSASGSVRIREAGEYRVSLMHGTDENQLELAVLRGAGEIFTDQGTTAVRAGERAYASAGLAPSYTYAYNSANWDAFDRWSEQRRDTRLGVSTQYLPSDMQQYTSTFDQYGDWQYAQPYGYVWYPRVAVGWRPYYYGRWVAYPRYGWTWVGVDHFAWPTHHYGRWGFSAGAWFWIPGNHWGPAWVSWGYANNYVSWCPLGFNNVPVVSINIFNSYGPHYYGHYPYYPAWTVVSRSHFGHGWVHDRAVSWERWNGARPAFTSATAVPINANVAVPRGSVPVRWAGTRADSAGGPGVRSTSLGPSGVRSQVGAGAGAAATATGPRDVAVPRTSGIPRYVNRGDQIVRSQTERPSAPAPPAPSQAGVSRRVEGSEAGGSRRAEGPAPSEAGMSRRAGAFGRSGVEMPVSQSGDAAVPRSSVGMRTVPTGPARRADEAIQIDRGAQDRQRGVPSDTGMSRRADGPAFERGVPRGSIGAPSPSYAPRYTPRNIPDARPGPDRSPDAGGMAIPRSRAPEPSGAREPGPIGGGAPRGIDRGGPAPSRPSGPAAAPAPSRGGGGGGSVAVPRSQPSNGNGAAAGSRRGGRGGN